MRTTGTCKQCQTVTEVSRKHLCSACANRNMVEATTQQAARSGPIYERTLAGIVKAKERRVRADCRAT
jgi:hypothetical protein